MSLLSKCQRYLFCGGFFTDMLVILFLPNSLSNHPNLGFCVLRCSSKAFQNNDVGVERFALSHFKHKQYKRESNHYNYIHTFLPLPLQNNSTQESLNHLYYNFLSRTWTLLGFLQHNGHGKCCMLSEEVKIASSIASRPTDYCLNLRFHRFHNFQLQPLEEIRMPYKRYQSELPFLQQYP